MSAEISALPTQPQPITKPRQGVPPPGPHKKRARAMTQLLILQSLLFKDAQDQTLMGPKRAMVTRAWKELEELRLRVNMKPPPKPADVADFERAKAKARERRESVGQVDYRKRKVVALPEPTPTCSTVVAQEPLAPEQIVAAQGVKPTSPTV